MTIKATPVIGRELKPGDLFSTVGPEYWSSIDRTGSVGERVYIRTNTPADNFPDADEMVYRIEVIREAPEREPITCWHSICDDRGICCACGAKGRITLADPVEHR